MKNPIPEHKSFGSSEFCGRAGDGGSWHIGIFILERLMRKWSKKEWRPLRMLFALTRDAELSVCKSQSPLYRWLSGICRVSTYSRRGRISLSRHPTCRTNFGQVSTDRSLSPSHLRTRDTNQIVFTAVINHRSCFFFQHKTNLKKSSAAGRDWIR